jgi:hypothetical protein
MNPSAAPAHIGEVVGRYSNDSPAETQREAVGQLIARVLRQAHREAEAVNELSEARGILHVAQSFADELADADPGFDRTRFIEDVAFDPS